MSTSSKPFVTLKVFLQHSTPYELWRAPIDVRLRSSILRAMASSSIICVVLWLLPAIHATAELWLVGPVVLLFSKTIIAVYWFLFNWRELLNWGNCALIVGCCITVLGTSGLRQGDIRFHLVGWLSVVATIGELTFLLLWLGLVMANIILWLAIISISGVALFLFTRSALRR